MEDVELSNNSNNYPWLNRIGRLTLVLDALGHMDNVGQTPPIVVVSESALVLELRVVVEWYEALFWDDHAQERSLGKQNLGRGSSFPSLANNCYQLKGSLSSLRSWSGAAADQGGVVDHTKSSRRMQ